MALPIRLRDEKVTQALISGKGIMVCDRCKMPLTPPAKQGYRRTQVNARVRYIVVPGNGGEKGPENCALMCGDCHDIFGTKIWVHKMFYDDWCNAYEGEAVSEVTDMADAEGEWK